MKIPREVPVMTLPEVTLFPHVLLPLRIFEPRYRQMLADALDSHRMFSVALRKPGTARETPLAVAGLGLIKVCVGHADGTSHLILQGMTRVKLEDTVRYKPYRIQKIRPLPTPPCDSVKVDALLAKVRELMTEWCSLEIPLPFPVTPPGRAGTGRASSPFSSREVLEYLESIANPAQVADAISSAVLPRAAERQAILESVDVETRLRRLIGFLLVEIQAVRHGGPKNE